MIPQLVAATDIIMEMADTFAQLAPAIRPMLDEAAKAWKVIASELFATMKEFAPEIKTFSTLMGYAVRQTGRAARAIGVLVRELARIAPILGIRSLISPSGPRNAANTRPAKFIASPWLGGRMAHLETWPSYQSSTL